MSKNKKWKEVKNQDLWVKQTSLLTPCPSALEQFSHMVACRSSLENTRKMNLILVLNKTTPWAHIKLELDMLGVPGKLVKYVVHFSKIKLKRIIFLHTSCPNYNWPVWSQGILGVKLYNNMYLTPYFYIYNLKCW